jgi:hypothetical protein
VLSAIDELKREMREITDLALSELKTRFVDNADRLYELVGALMLPNAELVDLIEGAYRPLIALYPAMVDADLLVAAQLDVIRHISR